MKISRAIFFKSERRKIWRERKILSGGKIWRERGCLSLVVELILTMVAVTLPSRHWSTCFTSMNNQTPAAAASRLSQRRGVELTSSTAATLLLRFWRHALLVVLIFCLWSLLLLGQSIFWATETDASLLSNNSDTSLSSTSTRPVATATATIAYAISLIKCSDKQTNTPGLLDAALILRHSIHNTSIRNPSSGSKYDYKLYVIAHATNAIQCASSLADIGYEVLLKHPPIQSSEIRGEHLRKNIHKEWCCGEHEFIKLYAYTITDHPIVVHTDIDFMFYQPMDELFDAMLFPSDSDVGMEARSNIVAEYPDKVMPENIEAYLTRDYHQVIPGRKAAFQAGFLVVKPNPIIFNEYIDIIREGNYIGGFSRENGWGGLGYGGVVGSMAMQGLPAYYYDIIRPNTTVELNGCRYNHMSANIYYENVPNFIARYTDLIGKCRRNVEGCEDCRKTDLALIKNIHYTNCRKPWQCAGVSSTSKGDIDPRTADFDHCMEVVRKWHAMRSDLEVRVLDSMGKNATTGGLLQEGQVGSYMTDVFMGHCSANGPEGYLPISLTKDMWVQLSDVIWN